MEIVERIFGNLRKNINNRFSVTKPVDFFNKSVNKIRLPPLNKENVLFYYVPLQGMVSYTTLSLSVMNPHLMVRIFPRRDITDILFLSAGSGAGLWLWARPHMTAASPSRRFSWAFLGGCLWPLGSIFLWAILRSSVGQRPIVGTVLGVTTGVVITNIALDYFSYLESMFSGEIEIVSPVEMNSPNSDDEKYDIDL